MNDMMINELQRMWKEVAMAKVALKLVGRS
jgi:hypothetical protein